jgi:uncharacterized FlaG/YvyC family protein
MEVSALSSGSFPASRASQAPALKVEREKAQNAVSAREIRKETPEQASPATSEARRAIQEARVEQAIQTTLGGSIEFEQDGGTRIMKVLDSKDVLIYQVPPKGALTLIKALEAEATQLLTSV